MQGLGLVLNIWILMVEIDEIEKKGGNRVSTERERIEIWNIRDYNC